MAAASIGYFVDEGVIDDLTLTLFVESVIDESARDPFDIISELEDELGYPIALS